MYANSDCCQTKIKPRKRGFIFYKFNFFNSLYKPPNL